MRNDINDVIYETKWKEMENFIVCVFSFGGFWWADTKSDFNGYQSSRFKVGG